MLMDSTTKTETKEQPSRKKYVAKCGNLLRESLPNIGDYGVEGFSKTMAALKKPQSLVLYINAVKGLKSDMGTPKALGFTKKQYYTNLKELVDLGLITREDNITYVHTVKGKILLPSVLSMLRVANEGCELAVIEEIKGAECFGNDAMKAIDFIRKFSTMKS
ncbi:MAG: hypothetical protein KGH66_01555 [Candidatus Micrarchaeota archaeon]|nr:hypothetical protein [Candidatus Micrarchaeota archaeon]